MSSGKPVKFVTVSMLVHVGCVFALLVAPALVPVSEGTDSSATVEFETLPPLGEQTTVLEEKIDEVIIPEEKVKIEKPVVVAPKETPVKTAAKEKILPTKLPPKEVVQEEAVEEVLPQVGVVAIEEFSEEPSEELAEETLEESFEEPIDEIAENLEPVVPEPLSTEVARTEDEVLENEAFEEHALMASEEESPSEVSALAEEDLKNFMAEEEAAAVESTTAEQSTSGAAPSFGTSQGVRNYEDLSQVPGNRPPQYPSQARLRRQQGQVVLQYFVDEAGRVSNMKLVKSSGFASLDQEAINSVSQYKYRPGQQGWTVHPVNFLLKGPEQKVGGRLRTSMR